MCNGSSSVVCIVKGVCVGTKEVVSRKPSSGSRSVCKVEV